MLWGMNFPMKGNPLKSNKTWFKCLPSGEILIREPKLCICVKSRSTVRISFYFACIDHSVLH